jgi:hypothetical protein
MASLRTNAPDDTQQRMAAALAQLVQGQQQNQAAANAMAVAPPPGPRPLPPRPPSQLAPMPVSPATPPGAALAQQLVAPAGINYGPQPPPSLDDLAGKISEVVSDPRIQNTLVNAATALGLLTPGPGGAAAGTAAGLTKAAPLIVGAARRLQAPTILRHMNPTAEDISAIKAAAEGYGRKGWPDATREVFKTTPEAYAETTQLVPQVSIKDRLPGPASPTEKLPIKDRARPIVENTPQIADALAEALYPMVQRQDPMLKFYHTGPVIRGLEQHADMSIPEANAFMRDWAGQGAATSPRTQTPPNLRNASYLQWRRASGDPLVPPFDAARDNIPGFPMMGMHVNLADKFARGVENPWINPKPTAFREAWSGNLLDVTGDTHNIRSTLYILDRLKPGSLPRPWFASDEAFAKYQNQGFLALDAGDIVDTLGSKAVNKVDRQSEYLPMVEPWYGAAQRLGIAPAEGQSGGWFNFGGITGLESPPKTITNLLNDQVEATSRALTDVSPEKVVDWWARRKIPLAGVAGTAGLGAAAASAVKDDGGDIYQ